MEARTHACDTSRQGDIVQGRTEVMARIFGQTRRMGESRLPVLITGPTGSGKDVMARLIHGKGACRQDPFVDLNCAAIPENLVESLLFGHEKGVFTGATTSHPGYFGLVGHGTLFLDEIAELPLSQQAKLLRVMENREYRPIGSASVRPFHGRVIAATHADMARRVTEKRFRSDLYYRLNVLHLKVPGLSDRREDIADFVDFFRMRAERPLDFTEGALALLARQEWPGNIRQLRNVVDRVAVLSDRNPVDSQTLSRFLDVADRLPDTDLDGIAERLLTLECTDKLQAIEGALVRQAMERSRGNKSEAARLLGVHRKVVERRFRGQGVARGRKEWTESSILQ